MSPRPMAAAEASRLLLRALGVADEQIPGDAPGRASVYRSLLRDRRALVVLDNAGSEEQVRPLLPGDGASLALITARRLLAGLEGVRRLVLGPLSLPEATRAADRDRGPGGRPRRAVITEDGNHPDVAALVYVTAFAPDTGESVSSLIADPPPGAPVPPILPPVNGFLLLDRDKFAASFAADVPAKLAAFMADSQLPAAVDALGGAVTEPAWRSKHSWYLVAADDHMIPPAALDAAGYSPPAFPV